MNIGFTVPWVFCLADRIQRAVDYFVSSIHDPQNFFVVENARPSDQLARIEKLRWLGKALAI